VRITIKADDPSDGSPPKTIEVPRTATKLARTYVPPASLERKPDQNLVLAIVRAHAWLADLTSDRYSSIEDLATAAKLHPKVVRQAIRPAFLAPDVTSAIVEGVQPEGLTLGKFPKMLTLPWAVHRQLLG